jgi:hypothetical protein
VRINSRNVIIKWEFYCGYSPLIISLERDPCKIVEPVFVFGVILGEVYPN